MLQDPGADPPASSGLRAYRANHPPDRSDELHRLLVGMGGRRGVVVHARAHRILRDGWALGAEKGPDLLWVLTLLTCGYSRNCGPFPQLGEF